MIDYKTIFISLAPYAFGKGMNPSFFSQAIGK